MSLLLWAPGFPFFLSTLAILSVFFYTRFKMKSYGHNGMLELLGLLGWVVYRSFCLLCWCLMEGMDLWIDTIVVQMDHGWYEDLRSCSNDSFAHQWLILHAVMQLLKKVGTIIQ